MFQMLLWPGRTKVTYGGGSWDMKFKFRNKHTGRKLSPSLNYFVLKTLQVRVRTTPPDVLSSLKKFNPLFRGPVLLKKIEPSLRGEGINTHTHDIFSCFFSFLFSCFFGSIHLHLGRCCIYTQE